MTVLSILAMSSLFAGAYLAVLPIVAAKVFHRGPAGFSLLAAMAGVGSVGGALLTGLRVNVPTLRSVGLLVAGFGVSMTVFALAPTWPLALILAMPVGLLYFSAMTTISTLLQFLADDNRRGRMVSLLQVGWAGLVPIGGLWLGIVAAARGARFALVVAGVVTATYALVATLRPVRGARDLQDVRQPAGACDTVL
jgi:MFS family permease